MDYEKIYGCLAQVLELECDEIINLSIDAKLSEKGLDSLHFIQMIILLEETFDIEINDSDLLISNFETIENIFKTLTKYEVDNEYE